MDTYEKKGRDLWVKWGQTIALQKLIRAEAQELLNTRLADPAMTSGKSRDRNQTLRNFLYEVDTALSYNNRADNHIRKTFPSQAQRGKNVQHNRVQLPPTVFTIRAREQTAVPQVAAADGVTTDGEGQAGTESGAVATLDRQGGGATGDSSGGVTGQSQYVDIFERGIVECVEASPEF